MFLLTELLMFSTLFKETSLCSEHWTMQNHKPDLSTQNKWLLSALFQMGHLYQLPQAHEALLNMGKQECKNKVIGWSTVNAVFGIEHGDCTTELTTVMDTCKRSSQHTRSINTTAGSTNWTSGVTRSSVWTCVCLKWEEDMWRTDSWVMWECGLRVDSSQEALNTCMKMSRN